MPTRRSRVTIGQRMQRYLIRQFYNPQVNRGIYIFLAILVEIFLLLKLEPIFARNFFKTTGACNFGLFISALILAMLAIIDDFSSTVRLEFWRSVLVKIILIIFACYLAYVSSQIKDNINDQMLTNERRSSNRLQKLRDKSYNDSLKVRTKEITNTFVTALAANGKEYVASQKKVIDMVRDSARRQIIEQKISPPEVFLDTVKANSYSTNMRRFVFYFKNRSDEAKDVNIKLYSVVLVNGLFYKLEESYKTIYFDQMNSLQGYQIFLDFTPKGPIAKYYFYMRGQYLDKSKHLYSYKNFIQLDGQSFRFSLPQGEEREGIIGLFKQFYPGFEK